MNFIAAGNSQGWISFLSHETLQALYSFEGHAMKIRCLAFTADETQLLSGSDDRTIKLFDVSDVRGAYIRSFCGHTGAVTCIRVDKSSTTSERFASIGVDNRIILWHIATGAKLHTIDYPGGTDTVSIY